MGHAIRVEYPLTSNELVRRGVVGMQSNELRLFAVVVNSEAMMARSWNRVTALASVRSSQAARVARRKETTRPERLVNGRIVSTLEGVNTGGLGD